MCTIFYRDGIYWAGNFTQRSFIFLPSDYVFFETSSTTPYQIRRIEELNKVRTLYDLFPLFYAQRLFEATRGIRSQRVFWFHFAQLMFHLSGYIAMTLVFITCISRLQMAMSKRKLCVSTDAGTFPVLLHFSPTNIKVSISSRGNPWICCLWPEKPWMGNLKLRVIVTRSCNYLSENLSFAMEIGEMAFILCKHWESTCICVVNRK